MTDRVNVPREWLERLEYFLQMTGVPAAHRERRTVLALLAAALKAEAVSDVMNDFACDSAYLAGMATGRNFGQDNDAEGYNNLKTHRTNQMVEARKELRAQPESQKGEPVAVGAFVTLEASAEAWSDRPEIRELITVATGAFEKWASPELMSRFRQNIMGVIQQAFMEGAMVVRPAPSSELLSFPYQQTFNAIADAVTWQPNKSFGISVEAFGRSFNAKRKGPQS